MWALGIVLDARRPFRPEGSGDQLTFGQHCSSRAFVHGGYRSSLCFADPEHQLVRAAVFNGTPNVDQAYQCSQGLATALYEDLNLVRI